MNFYEALQAFKESVDDKSRPIKPTIGIRSVEWRKHPTKRFIYRTGVDFRNMFGVVYYDFIKDQWLRTWSVFMPTFYEVYDHEWEIVPAKEAQELRLKSYFLPDQEALFGILTFCSDPNDKRWRERYDELVYPKGTIYTPRK